MGLKKLKLAVLISGRGSNMRSILEACKDPEFPAEIIVVLSNRPDAKGLTLAREAGIPTEIINHKDFATREDFEDEMQARLEKHSPDLVILAGFMRILTSHFVEKWLGRMVNIHPSLLPDYKGLNTHERAINDGKTEAGCSVHFVTPELDSGEVILQRRVPILESDTPETLAERVLEQEHIIYPEAIRLISSKYISL